MAGPPHPPSAVLVAALPALAVGCAVGVLLYGTLALAGVSGWVAGAAGVGAAALVVGLHAALGLVRRRRSTRLGPGWLGRVPVGLFRLDREGRFTAANPALARLLGVDPVGALVGRHVRSVVAEAGRLGGWKEALAADGWLDGRECTVEHGEGGTRVVQVWAQPTRDGYLGAAIDVTRRRVLFEQLREARGLESIGRLAGGVAHDFKNLLSVVGGNAELLLADPRLDDPSRELVLEILDATRRGTAMAGQLLGVGRRRAEPVRALAVNRTVGDMIRLLERAVGDHVQVEVELGDRVPSVRIAPAQLDQIVLNLVVNARDAMPSGGCIRVRTSHAGTVRPDEPGRGRFAVIEVTDSGTGIEPEMMDRIFEPYYTTKAANEGTGLGLATVRDCVREAGGYVTVDSSPGRSTTFRVHLPEATDLERLLPLDLDLDLASELDSTPPTETVLVVEDEDAVRRLLVRVLADAGYDVVAARSPAEARAQAERQPPDILVTDLVLPGERGTHLGAWFARRFPGVGVVVTSGHPREAVREGLPTPDATFLQKPFSRQDALDAVRRAAARPDRRRRTGSDS